MKPTSRAAFESLPDLTGIKSKIVAALQKIGTATSEQIADYMKEKHDRIWKRLSELEKVGLIEETGTTALNRSGRKANTYRVKQIVNY